MPTSTLGALNAWGVYLVASLALIGLLSPALAGTASRAREGADYREVDGVRAVLDGLRPGLAVSFSFGASTDVDPILLGGHTISSSYGGGNISAPSRWLLPGTELFPTVHYLLALEGNRVKVTPLG